MNQTKAILEIDPKLSEELEANGCYLFDELITEHPEYKAQPVSNPSERDVASVLTASAAVIAALQPILITLMKRWMPNKNTEVEIVSKTKDTLRVSIKFKES